MALDHIPLFVGGVKKEGQPTCFVGGQKKTVTKGVTFVNGTKKVWYEKDEEEIQDLTPFTIEFYNYSTQALMSGSVTPRFTTSGTSFEYSLDNGTTWTSVSSGTSVSVPNGRIQFRGMGRTGLYTEANYSTNIWGITSSGRCRLSGNIMTLLDYQHPGRVVMSAYAFSYMFCTCNILTTVSSGLLPAKRLSDSCYYALFYQASLENCPDLPATKLQPRCYTAMFGNCGITTLPALPATTMEDHCYSGMFNGCSSVTTVPSNYLPATTLAAGCYNTMFQSCNLTNLPDLPATTLAPSCYSYMFAMCTGFTTVPANYLPATTLVTQCYYGMFRQSNLIIAPSLPATTLEPQCYREMFYGCTKLTTAPLLSAPILVESCYQEMFRLNSSGVLNNIICLATDISATNCLTNWVYGVPSTGTFTKKSGVTYPTGVSGIPSGWSVVNV